MEKLLLTDRQAAEQLGISVRQVHNIMKDGRFSPVYIGRSLRIRQEDLDAFVKSLISGYRTREKRTLRPARILKP